MCSLILNNIITLTTCEHARLHYVCLGGGQRQKGLENISILSAEMYTCPSIRVLASRSHVRVPTCTRTRNEFQKI